jgi:hypothetical protein
MMNESILWEKRFADPLAVILGQLRTDWQMPGIMAALADQRLRAKAPATVVLAAVRAASNPKVRTPAVIPMEGEHWLEQATAPLTPPKYRGEFAGDPDDIPAYLAWLKGDVTA